MIFFIKNSLKNKIFFRWRGGDEDGKGRGGGLE